MTKRGKPRTSKSTRQRRRDQRSGATLTRTAIPDPGTSSPASMSTVHSDVAASSRTVPPTLTEAEQAERTAQWYDECMAILDMRSSVEEQFPELSRADVDMFFAGLVIGNNLGDEWVEINVEPPSPRNDGRRTKNTNTSQYLRRQPGDRRERLEHYIRVMELARRIFELGQEPFAGQLMENLRRRDLEGAAFEADVVRMLISLPTVVNMRDEIGVKGDDYDIDLWLQPQLPWAVEVKTRAEESGYTPDRLKTTLNRARSQLPARGLGGIFLKIPTPWTKDTDYLDGHSTAIKQFLANTTRVQAVITVWDVWEDDGAKWSWSRSQSIFKSTQIDPVLDELLTHLDRVWNNTHDFIGPTAPF